MNFLKSKFGVILILLSLIVMTAVVWFCFGGCVERKMPEGTLVFQEDFR